MRVLKINEKDSVAVATTNVSKGEKELGVEILQDVNFAHKIAIKDIKKGEVVIKYGYPIGRATCDICAGEWVHTHNVQSEISSPNVEFQKAEVVEKSKTDKTFMGYKRANGKVGTRNILYVVSIVGCVNTLVSKMSSVYCGEYAGVDEVISVTHQFGCSQLGDDHENTLQVLCNIADNPNCGGILYVGLGCENITLDSLQERLTHIPKDRIDYLITQDVEDEFVVASEKVEKLMSVMAGDKREEVSLDKLVLGLKCGGSDGLSGITANPAIGQICDYVTSVGGSVIMTEVPEMFGSEISLLERSKDEEVFHKTDKLIEDFKDYYRSHGMPVGENPSPGNKKGGITTNEEKSLGCTQKSGKSEVTDVLLYSERVRVAGLSLLSAPGNDMIAVSTLSSAGANLILFSTGRGTPLGSLVPVVKIASNNPLALRKKNWIDFDASIILDGEDCREALLSAIIKYASGEKTKAEEVKSHDFAIFKNGIIL